MQNFCIKCSGKKESYCMKCLACHAACLEKCPKSIINLKKTPFAACAFTVSKKLHAGWSLLQDKFLNGTSQIEFL